MTAPKDFTVGCLVILIIALCVMLVPVAIFVFKLSFFIVLAIGIILVAILAVTILGKLIRFIFFRKEL